MHWTSQANPAGQVIIFPWHVADAEQVIVHVPPEQPPVHAVGHMPPGGGDVLPQTWPEDEVLVDEDVLVDEVVLVDDEDEWAVLPADDVLVEDDELVGAPPVPPAPPKLLDVEVAPPSPEEVLDALVAAPDPPVSLDVP